MLIFTKHDVSLSASDDGKDINVEVSYRPMKVAHCAAQELSKTLSKTLIEMVESPETTIRTLAKQSMQGRSLWKNGNLHSGHDGQQEA